MFSFLRNKHLIIAMLVAPILAVIAWFVTDRTVRPEAQTALAGETYELLARPNCRYESSKCELVNGDVKLTIEAVANSGNQNPSLKFTSTVPVEILRVEFLDSTNTTRDIVQHGNKNGLFELNGLVDTPLSEVTSIRLGLVSLGVNYYAETNTAFLGEYPD